jgi:hypothetical protein
MLIGYSLVDPIVVIGFTVYCLWLLLQSPVRLFSFLPAALSLYFFIPSLTLITLWQTVPALLFLRGLLGRGLKFPPRMKLGLQLLLAVLAVSFLWPVLAQGDLVRASIRLFYYLTVFALFSYSYELGAHPRALPLLVKGLVITGLIYGFYGAYQLVAVQVGLPVRGIVYGASPVSLLPVQGAFARINSFANEPKRLGYVLFLASLASFYWAGIARGKKQFIAVGAFAFVVSLFTFSASYYGAILVFLVVGAFLYPKYASSVVLFLAVLGGFLALFNLDALVETVRQIVDARFAEFELGVDGRFVYRQEFFAFDFLGKDPFSSLFGVGLGQYFRVLSERYGSGVGIGDDGRTLLPLNSVVFELIFDLGLAVAAIIYAFLARLVLRLRNAGEDLLALSLLFLVVQSLWIQTSLFIAVFAGLGLARLDLRAGRRFVRVSGSAHDPSSQNAGSEMHGEPAQPLAVRAG